MSVSSYGLPYTSWLICQQENWANYWLSIKIASMAQNGIRLLFNNDKTEDEQDAAIMTIQAAISDLCTQYDIFQLEVNYTHGK
jgi:hypothetical protein